MLLANRNSVFDEMFRDPFFTRPFENISTQVMKTDVHEKDGNYLLEIELPGYAKEDISADLENGYLVIQAAKKNEKNEKDEKGNCIRCERYSGSCQRSFYVGKEVKKENIKAGFNNGILQIVIPKLTEKAVEKSSKIMIE